MTISNEERIFYGFVSGMAVLLVIIFHMQGDRASRVLLSTVGLVVLMRFFVGLKNNE